MNEGLTDALWFLSRGTGTTALVLLTVTVALGIAARSRRPLPGLPRFAVTAIHRSASLVAVILVAVHVASLLLDPYAQLKIADLAVPFAGAYRPLWLGLGTLAFDLLAAVIATSLLRHRIGQRTWRVVHWSSYAVWPLAVAHGLGSGTDAGSWWLQVLAVACLVAVAAAVAWRCSGRFATPPAQRVPIGERT